MQKIDKQFVCRQFRRAAASYDRQATIQHRVADRLLGMLVPYVTPEPLRVLEIGCCTGLLTGKLLQSDIKVGSLLLNDLMPDFAERLPQNLAVDELGFLPGDIEKLSLPGSFDLIISSSTFHWLHSPRLGAPPGAPPHPVLLSGKKGQNGQHAPHQQTWKSETPSPAQA
ncbi:MAG: methyltransferase domain-containing protein [Candidatus Electrothrix sp. AUS4]|nr:methyltransferase domain-containing protein [Candidatus Electrothrix sp. AUS4]